MLVREIIKKMQRRKRVRRRRKTQDARRKMQTQSKRVLISLYVLISYQLWLYIWPPLHSYTHTLTLSNSHSLAPSLSYWSFFFPQNLHPLHDPPRKDGRSSEYLEQERRYYKSYSSSSLLYHFFFFFVIGFLLSFVFSF